MSRHLGALRERRLAGEQGFTLIEMSVVLLILGILVPLIFMLLDQVTKNESWSESRYAAGDQGQIIGETLSRQIHAWTSTPASPPSGFPLASADELRFFASLGNAYGPTAIDVYPAQINNTWDLVEDVYQPQAGGTYPNSPTTSKQILGTGLVVPAPSADDCTTPGIFEYFAPPTANPPASPTALCITSGTALTSGQLSSVESVTVAFTTEDAQRPKNSPLDSYSLSISLPNVDFQNG